MPRVWLLLLLPFTCYLHGSEQILAEHSILIQRSPNKTQGIIALGTSHEHNKARDQKWAQCLVDEIREADARAAKEATDAIPYYVFVEHAFPCRLATVKKVGDQAYGSITGGLVTLSEHKPFSRSVVVNCEVRKKYAAAFQLLTLGAQNLQPNYQWPAEFFQELASNDPIWIGHCKKTYNCTFGALTFADLYEEFETLYAKTLIYKKQLEYHQDYPLLAKIFDPYLAAARDELEEFKKSISNPSQTVWSFSLKLLYEQKSTIEKERLGMILANAFEYFVDLFVLYQIILLQKKPVEKIIFYVGSDHQAQIAHFLDYLGYYHLYPPMEHSPSRASHASLRMGTLKDEHFVLIKKPFAEINAECEKAIRVETREFMRRYRYSI